MNRTSTYSRLLVQINSRQIRHAPRVSPCRHRLRRCGASSESTCAPTNPLSALGILYLWRLYGNCGDYSSAPATIVLLARTITMQYIVGRVIAFRDRHFGMSANSYDGVRIRHQNCLPGHAPAFRSPKYQTGPTTFVGQTSKMKVGHIPKSCNPEPNVPMIGQRLSAQCNCRRRSVKVQNRHAGTTAQPRIQYSTQPGTPQRAGPAKNSPAP